MNNKKASKKTEYTKTFSMRFRFLATVICAMFAITVLVGGISIYEVNVYVKEQAQDFVKVTCTNESSRINDSLSDIEKSVKIMESYLMDFLKDGADVTDPALQKTVIENADQMFVDVAHLTNTGGAVAYYFRFAPSIADGKAGLFYSKEKGSDTFVSFEPTDISLYEKGDIEHVGWFWLSYEAGEPIWLKPYYNQNNQFWMISYVIPMYVDGTFIGVVGMDFDYMVLAEHVHSVTVYENGFAHLESDGEIICDDVHEEADRTEKRSQEYLQVSQELVNGMTLVVSASYDDIRQIRYEIAFKILFATAILSVLFMLLAVLVVQRIVDPLKKLTDAAAKLSDGDYNVDIAQSNTYEIKLLSTAFENMTTRLHEREELLHLSANRDSLTGLRNTTSYMAWAKTFDKEIENQNTDFGMVVLDVNGLKGVNDTYGHGVGDELIAVAAKIISDVFKDCLVFRIGGDEFLVVLQNESLDNREALFAQFDQTCANTFIEKEAAKIPVRIAVGFARFDANTDARFADVCKRADDAMYENKRKSKAHG